MEQEIRFCSTSDGVSIAYATLGQGPPLVLAWGWIGNLQFDWRLPEGRAFLERLAQGCLLVRYNKRGTGLSDWDAEDLSMEGWLRDLEAVVDTLGLERFALMGVSEGGATAILYRSRHPERVSRLILYGSYHRFPGSREIVGPLLALVKAQWGLGSAALATVFVPDGDPAKVAAFTEYQRVSASGQTAAKMLEVNADIDVTSLLKDIQIPTLVIHRRHDRACPFRGAREMTALIPGARLEPLEGDDHVPFWGDSEAITDAIDRFLQEGEVSAQTETPVAPSGLLTILFTDVEGSTNLTQRLGDAKAQELLRTHNSIVRDALKAHGGTEIKHTGDGIMASFPLASSALGSAIAIQRAVAAQVREHPEMPLRVRIGLNAGEPVAEEEDLFGTAVQLAARICAHAEPGQILVPTVVRELAAGKGFLLADLGQIALRGFEDPVRLYEVRWGEEG